MLNLLDMVARMRFCSARPADFLVALMTVHISRIKMKLTALRLIRKLLIFLLFFLSIKFFLRHRNMIFTIFFFPMVPFALNTKEIITLGAVKLSFCVLIVSFTEKALLRFDYSLIFGCESDVFSHLLDFECVGVGCAAFETF